jgi:hypothetical protein
MTVTGGGGHVFGRVRPSHGGDYQLNGQQVRVTTFRQLPAPTGTALFRLDVKDVLSADAYQQIPPTFDLLNRPIAKEFALIITSSTPEMCTPADIYTHTRGQWGIENKVPWIRDVVWNEDHNQTHTGNTAQAFAGLKNLALGLLRLKGITTIKAAIEDIASDRYHALTVMTT